MSRRILLITTVVLGAVLAASLVVVGGGASEETTSQRVVDDQPTAAPVVGAADAPSDDVEPPSPTVAPTPAPTPRPLAVTSTRVVGRLTGAGSINDTATRWNVHGTDLGHTFAHGGSLYMVFGDTWGAGGVEGADWRSNVMARIDDPDPTDGLTFAAMVTGPAGLAKELLPSRKVAGVEKTVIPTYGYSDGSRMYLHYMSVRSWGDPGRWEAGSAGFAFSDDDGSTWVKDPLATFDGGSNFVQVAMTERDGWVYVYGIPAGRFGGVRLARVRPANLLDIPSYAYWTGDGWGPAGAATDIVPAPVGELSVRYSEHHGKWLMMYLNEERRAIVLRTADRPSGPWDDERLVVTADEHPQLYAPYMLPAQTGAEILFTMSRFDIYNVLLMGATIE